MPLIPRRAKHHRELRGRMHDAAKGGKITAFGEYSLMALESHWITNRQTEAARVAMTHYMKRGGKVRIRVFPHKSHTAKGAGVRTGFGKGTPAGWVTVVKRGKIMFEIGSVSEGVAHEALRLVSTKLPIKCKFVVKSTEVGGELNEG